MADGFEPIARSIERRGTEFRCYSPANPHYYLDDQRVLRPVAPDHVAAVRRATVGDIALARCNPVTVGRRTDGNGEKLFGFRPDDRQDGSVQLEFDVEAVEINGVAVPTSDIVLARQRNQGRILAHAVDGAESFRMLLRARLTGLTAEEHADRGEMWLRDIDGVVFARILPPRAYVSAEGARRDDCNLSGTFADITADGFTFEKRLSAPFSGDAWLDATIIYSETSDGFVYYANSNWDTCHDAATGTVVDDSATASSGAMLTQLASGTYKIRRSFYYFNTDGITESILRCSLHIRGVTNADSSVEAQAGTQADTLTTADFDSFSGSEFGHVAWIDNGYNVVTFNSAGRDHINPAGITKICCREYTFDYLDDVPGVDGLNGACYSDYTGTARDPYLKIEDFSGSTYRVDSYARQAAYSASKVLTEATAASLTGDVNDACDAVSDLTFQHVNLLSGRNDDSAGS